MTKAAPKKLWESDDRDKLLTYNALDTCATARVDREIMSEDDWGSPRVRRLLEVHEGLSKLGSEIHMTGFTIHQENRKGLIKQLKMLTTRRKNELVKHVGPRRSPAFRGTPDDMRSLLYNKYIKDGIRCYHITEPNEWDKEMWTQDGSNYSVGKPALMRIFINPATPEECRDIIELYWRARAPGKALSTWVGMVNSKGEASEVQQKICDDGRMRADWNSAGTETMRWAGELMTLPQDKDDETLGGKLPNIRSMYCATKGYNLFHWDWSQQELRMWRAIYKDGNLGKAITTGDVYSFDARQWFEPQLRKMFGAQWDTINLKKNWKDGRKQVKVIHLGAQYMAGPPVIWTQGLLQDRKLQFHTVRALHSAMHKTYEVGFNNIQKNHELVNKIGYSRGHLLDGRRYYPAPPPITETANYDIQRTAGEMGALTMLAIANEIKKQKMPVRILTNEHDAGTMEYLHKDSIERELAQLVKEKAEGPWAIDGDEYPFPVDYHTGHTWADACAD